MHAKFTNMNFVTLFVSSILAMKQKFTYWESLLSAPITNFTIPETTGADTIQSTCNTSMS